MRLKLRAGVHAAPVQQGVLFVSARDSFVIGGPPPLFPLVDACIPVLEQGATVDELVAALGQPSARPVVQRVVDTLLHRGLVLDLDSMGTWVPSASDRAGHGPLLAYLEERADHPYAAFAQVRRTAIDVVGDTGAGQARESALRGLRRSGIGGAAPDGAAPGIRIECRAAGAEDAATGSWAGATVDAERADSAVPAVVAMVGEERTVVTPLLPPAARETVLRALWLRTARWQHATQTDPAPRPLGDVLGGALAAQQVMENLAGTARPGVAYVITGSALDAEPVTLPGRGIAALSEQRALTAVAAEAVGETDAIVERVEKLCAPWIGWCRSTTPDDLPQLPVALAVCSDVRTHGQGASVRWAADQPSALVEATLAVLRDAGTGLLDPAGGAGPARQEADRGTTAAGVTELLWLLDGALRELTGRISGGSPLAWEEVDDLDVLRLWRTLEDYESVPVRLESASLPGVPATLVTVSRTDTGERLARQWGAGTEDAALAALAGATARIQVLERTGQDLVGDHVGTGVIARLTPETHLALAQAIGSMLKGEGSSVQGRYVCEDPLLGEVPLFVGQVWIA
ncbi:hypothetical protein ADL21_00825 [Streptomyces albus subsp. albus]|nr:hypothetical protein ADL21_00825 [Streptomyces albus subsp. albus]